MREHRFTKKCAASAPVEMFCNGGADGYWLLDSSASRIQFTIKQFWGLSTIRGAFDSFAGGIDIGRGGSIAASLSVDASSVNTGSARRDAQLRRAAALGVPPHPTVKFRSDHVLLMVPDEAWVTGTVTVAGRKLPVAFEAFLTVHSRYVEAVVDAKIVLNDLERAVTSSARRIRAKAVMALHLVFVPEY